MKRNYMIISVEQFDTYSGNYEGATDVVAMKESMLASAQEIVADYLGFNPESEERTDYVEGIGNNHLYLFAHPISAVSEITFNGMSLLPSAYTICDNYLRLNEGVWPNATEIKVSYTAGWSADNVPETVRMVILQIATLMLQESGGNIGITGKTISDDSKTFINYTNYDKWLKKLDALRIVRLYG